MTATAATAGSQDIVVEGEASIMGPSSSSSLWWFIDTKVARQHIRGPYTVSQMGVLFDVGTLTHTTQVWKARGEGDDEGDGSDEWRSLKQATDLIHDMDTLNNNDDNNNNNEEDIISQRLPLDKIPSTEIRQCTSCIVAQKEGYCDLTYFWDRPNKMWLLWDEYETLCRNEGLIDGLIINNNNTTHNNVLLSKQQQQHDGDNDEQKQRASKTEVYVPLDDPDKEAKRKKRREYRARKKLKQQAGLWKARVKDENNPNIYISGLPNDITLEELYNLFKLAGAIKTDMETGRYKIKIYDKLQQEEEEGDQQHHHPTGDALISYQSTQSVSIAINRYDEYLIRPDCRIHVARASFGHDDDYGNNKKLAKIEDYHISNDVDNNTLQLMANRNNKRRLKLLELRRKELEAAASWEDDEAGRDRAWKPIIVLKGMYSVEEANSDHAEEIYANIKADVQAEMSRFGEVKKVVVIEDSLDAYVCIKFKTMDEAQNAAAHLASNNLIIPSIISSGVGDKRSSSSRIASGMFFHDGRDLKSRPILSPPTPSNNSVMGSSTQKEEEEEEGNEHLQQQQQQRDKEWEHFLLGGDEDMNDDDDDEEFIIHKEDDDNA